MLAVGVHPCSALLDVSSDMGTSAATALTDHQRQPFPV